MKDLRNTLKPFKCQLFFYFSCQNQSKFFFSYSLRRHLEREERELGNTADAEHDDIDNVNDDQKQDENENDDDDNEATPKLTTSNNFEDLKHDYKTEVDDTINQTKDQVKVENGQIECENNTETETKPSDDEETKLNQEVDRQIANQMNSINVNDISTTSDEQHSPKVVKKPLFVAEQKPQRTKKEKRRAREAAKRAQENAVPITLVSYRYRYMLIYIHILIFKISNKFSIVMSVMVLFRHVLNYLIIVGSTFSFFSVTRF